jgi:NAD(P)H-hydrate epimerase
MFPKPPASFEPLAGAQKARALDGEAAEWGLCSDSLVEAAGRACAELLVQSFPRYFANNDTPSPCLPAVLVLAGSGNNAADALVMLRTLVIKGCVSPAKAPVLISKLPITEGGLPLGSSPLVNVLLSLKRLNIPVIEWEACHADKLCQADIIIDGLAGTGLQGPLRGKALEMAEATERFRQGGGKALVVSIDLPSGNFEGWQPQMPLIQADATLAIEPRKLCLYSPAARLKAGKIIPVQGIFPPALLEKYREASLLDWENCAAVIPAVEADAHKYRRGLVEIRAGSQGAAGAAMLAARGAQAAGAGLVRLIVDPSLYPLLAPGSGGIMVVPDGGEVSHNEAANGVAGKARFVLDALLLGPGWGRGADRAKLLESLLSLEAGGVPLVLDADAIALARGMQFHGNVILTPHPGEFAEYTGLPKTQILADPIPVLRPYAKESKAHILLKGHVLYLASPSGEIGIVDGVNPALAAGGSGDVLAGFCAAIAGRMGAAFDGFACAAAAATLLMEAGRAAETAGRFSDPMELAHAAAGIAGRAWLPKRGAFNE